MIKFRMKDEGPQIEDERLIEEVRMHPFLYDTRNCDYRNLPLRASVWADISKTLNIQDQNAVQKRWKVLREKFSIAYRKNVLEEVNSNWIYYDALTFLEPFVNLKPENKKSGAQNDDAYKMEHSNSPVSKSPLDEHYLIKLVKERPVLYDKKHEDFRVGDSRKKAWDEIAAIANWDIDTLQKRWRVMRDRFVRELRRSKNADSDVHISCSSFFREMLFLTYHVRSKKYEVEAHFDGSDDDSKEFDWQVEEVNVPQRGSISSDTDGGHVYEQYLEDAEIEYEEGTIVEEIEQHEVVEEEEQEEDEEEDEYIEEIIESSSQNEEVLCENDEDGQTTYEAIIEDNVLIKSDMKAEPTTIAILENHKRRISDDTDFQHQPAVKLKRMNEPSASRVPNESPDEDVAFGNTLGCMLKKIPQHLKTSIKLKLLQSFAEFEAQHKLG